jgi:hypothetical protein
MEIVWETKNTKHGRAVCGACGHLVDREISWGTGLEAHSHFDINAVVTLTLTQEISEAMHIHTANEHPSEPA